MLYCPLPEIVNMKSIVTHSNKLIFAVYPGFCYTNRILLTVLGDWWFGGSTTSTGVVGHVAAAPTGVLTWQFPGG